MYNCLWFTVLGFTSVCCLGCTPVHCLGCHTVLLCVMLALYATSWRESAVGLVLCGCGATCRALPPVLQCRKARLPCLYSCTMLFSALSLLIVIFLSCCGLECLCQRFWCRCLEFPCMSRRFGFWCRCLRFCSWGGGWWLTVCVSVVNGGECAAKGERTVWVSCRVSGLLAPAL